MGFTRPKCDGVRGFVETQVFDAIKSFVADLASGDKPAGSFDDNDYRVAVAALLVHAASVDGTISKAERDTLRLTNLLKRRFDLDDAAAAELIEYATAAEQDAIDLYHFTRVLNRSLDEGARLRLIEMMWEIAYADGTVTQFEDNLIWRVADLLGVSSNERIALRQRVAAASGKRRRMTPVTVITGASAGIGAELARVFAANGHALALVARREQRLEALADEIAATGRPKPLVLPIDLAMPHAAAWIGRALAARALEPEYIVNNAGFGLVGRAADTRPRRATDDDRPQHARARRFLARVHRQPWPAPRRPA